MVTNLARRLVGVSPTGVVKWDELRRMLARRTGPSRFASATASDSSLELDLFTPDDDDDGDVQSPFCKADNHLKTAVLWGNRKVRTMIMMERFVIRIMKRIIRKIIPRFAGHRPINKVKWK